MQHIAENVNRDLSQNSFERTVLNTIYFVRYGSRRPVNLLLKFKLFCTEK